ncbi:MAG: hypothetical protein V9G12_04055 [Microthrixaceae bacterium]|jgi:DNA-binding NarL/FixJ family response regulator
MHVLLVEDQKMFAESLARLVAGRPDVASVSVAASLKELQRTGVAPPSRCGSGRLAPR